MIYEELLTDRPELAVYPVDKAALRGAAYARSVVADAIHVATAINEQADYFITNDDKLRTPAGIQKISLSELEI